MSERKLIKFEDLERAVELDGDEETHLNLVNKLHDLIVNRKTIPSSSLYDPKFIKELIYHVGVLGKSYKSLAFKLGVSDSVLYTWEKKFPEWKMAKEIANQGRTGYLEDLLTGLADGSHKGNAAAAIFYSKNAAPDDFKDKRDIEVSGAVTYVIDTGIPANPKSLENKPIEVDYFEVESPTSTEKALAESDEDLL